MTVMLIAALLPILGFRYDWLRYVFAAAALLVLAAQVATPSPSSELRVRRLSRMNVWAGVLYCVSAGCLFVHDASMQQSWVAFLLAGAVLQIYATIMLSKLTDKKNQ